MGNEKSLVSISQLFAQAVAERPEGEAVYDLTRRLTYGELHREVDRIAASISQMGVKKGDRIGVCLPNWHEVIVLYLAITKLCAIVVPFNTGYRSHEVEYIIKNSGMKLVFVSEEFNRNIGINAISSYVKNVVPVRFAYENCLSYDQLLQDHQPVNLPTIEIDPKNDVFCILYTSGTTGFPKGAMLTHENVFYAGKTVTECNACTQEDVFLVAVPLFHVFGVAACFSASLYSQAKLVLLERFRAKHALEVVEQEKVTIHHGVPTMFILELNDPDLESYDLSSLRTGFIAASPCPAEVIKGIRERLGLNICVAYGATETTATVTITRLENEQEINVLETVGRAVKGAEVRIVNDAREEVLSGEVGEICCRGMGIMKGYYNAPEQTQTAMDSEGWYYTGDLGTLDETGYLRIVGRKKEMIIRGGFNIYPREIEEILYRHEKIMEAAVIGLPDPVLGEYVCAVIKLKPGAEADSEEIKEYVKTFFVNYKVPSKIMFVEDFPVTASGKIMKGKLKERLLDEQMSL